MSVDLQLAWRSRYGFAVVVALRLYKSYSPAGVAAPGLLDGSMRPPTRRMSATSSAPWIVSRWGLVLARTHKTRQWVRSYLHRSSSVALFALAKKETGPSHCLKTVFQPDREQT